MRHYFQFIRQTNGAAVVNADVTVTVPGTTTEIQCYSDADGSTTLSQPFKTDSRGMLEFYCYSGIVDILVDSGLSGTWSFQNVNLAYQPPLVLNVKDFGAKGDGTGDDTIAIQDTLNTAAGFGGTVYFPSGHYIITNLYLGYDLNKNPNWPNSERNYGRISLIGEGPCFEGDIGVAGASIGSVLDSVSTNLSDAAITILQYDTNPLRASSFLTISKLSIRYHSSNWVIDGNAVSINANLVDVQIYPINVYGAGGVIFNSAWVNKWANIGVRGVTGSQGVGIKMINGDGSGGGSLSFLNCDATSMSHGWQFGDTEWVSGDPSSSPMTNISLTCCNAGNADVGMEFGRSVWAANLNACHFEESTVGIRIGRMAQGVKLQGCYIADNETGIELGYDSTSGSRIWRNVSLDTCTIRVGV